MSKSKCFGSLYESRAKPCQVCVDAEACYMVCQSAHITRDVFTDNVDSCEKKFKTTVQKYILDVLRDTWKTKNEIMKDVASKFNKGKIVAAKELLNLKKKGLIDVKIDGRKWYYKCRP